ncbi:MAG: hypothetical protein WCJ58_04155 [bacterium]
MTEAVPQNVTNKSDKSVPVLGIAIISGLGIVFVIVIVAVIIFASLKPVKKKTTTPGNNDGTVQLTTDKTAMIGFLRSAGLDLSEANKLALFSTKYQLELDASRATAQHISGYYLETTQDLTPYWNQCVYVQGKIKPDWEQVQLGKQQEFNGYNTYGRSALVLSKIQVIESSYCSNEAEAQGGDQTGAVITLSGIIQNSLRPAPDINYDYVINLDVPYIDEFSPAGSPAPVSQMDLVPTDEMKTSIGDYLGKKVTITALIKWGYAESRYLEVLGVEVSK